MNTKWKNIITITYKMRNIWLIIILFFILLTIIEIIKQNPDWWNNKREGFITSFSEYVNLDKVKPVNITNNIDNSEIILKSPVPPTYKLGIENNNSVDILIAQYFTNNIIPSTVDVNYNSILLNHVENNKLDLAFIREYELLRYIKANPDSNIRVIMPTFNKYLLALTSANNDIEYIEDINNFVGGLRGITTQNICYINDDDLELVKTIISLQIFKQALKNKINYVKINKYSEIGPRDIFIGLIVPKDEEDAIRNNKLKPIYYHPTTPIPNRNKRINLNIKVNEEDKNDIREFHYDLKGYFDWLLQTEIFPTPESIAYRTYKVRFLLVCNSESKLETHNFRTLINNWWSHRMPLKNIYHMSEGKRRGYPAITDTFTDLASIDSSLKFYDEMRVFLKNKKLLDY